MRILFRADASEALGTGHVMRCLALAEQLRARGARVTFACRPLPAELARLLAAAGCELVELPATSASQRADAAAVRDALPEIRFDWAVVDHYGLDAAWEEEMRAGASRILVIDDLAGRAHRCDLLLDQNPGKDKQARYRARAGADLRCLIGPRYALLRPGFAAARARSGPRRGAIGRILVMFGGSDPTDETAKAVRALQGVPGIASAIDVVVGSANPRSRELRAACARDARMRFHAGASDVPRLMADADLALGACGITAWERCAIYLPALAVVVAGNQRDVAAGLAAAGAAEIAGWHAEVSAQDLAHAVQRLAAAPERVRELSRRAGEQTDGRGAERLVEAMEEAHAH